MQKRTFHPVQATDTPRIPCTTQDCAAHAEVGHRTCWNTGNTAGVSYFYYCTPCSTRVRTTGKSSS